MLPHLSGTAQHSSNSVKLYVSCKRSCTQLQTFYAAMLLHLRGTAQHSTAAMVSNWECHASAAAHSFNGFCCDVATPEPVQCLSQSIWRISSSACKHADTMHSLVSTCSSSGLVRSTPSRAGRHAAMTIHCTAVCPLAAAVVRCAPHGRLLHSLCKTCCKVADHDASFAMAAS
jgi:hypothetical protein